MLYALGANLMMTCYGLVFSASGFMIPQLEDPVGGFGIDKNDGSWLGDFFLIFSRDFFFYFQNKTYLLIVQKL